MTSQNSPLKPNDRASADPGHSQSASSVRPARGTLAAPGEEVISEDKTAPQSADAVALPVPPPAPADNAPEILEEIAEQANAPSSSLSGRGSQIVSLESGYVMVRQIGRGNFGEVWLSEAPGGVEVALKLVDIPSGRRIKQTELRSLDLMKRLRHPFLMQVQAFWVSEEQITIAMELADQSLRDCAAEYEPQGIPPGELLRLMFEAAEGIDYLHREHVVHRDIKPENLLLLKGHIKVADFGLARFMDESGLSIAATQVAGSPLYMAPEVWEGKPEFASDQYSLAMTYIELRLGRSPFSSTSIVTIMQEHLHGQPNLSSLPEAEQVVLRKALAKRPERRFGSCTEMVQALQRSVAPGVTQPASRAASPGTWALLVGLPLLMTCIFGLAAWRLWPTSQPYIDFPEKIAVEYGSRQSQHTISLAHSDQQIQSVRLAEPIEGLSVEYDPTKHAVQFQADVSAPVSSSPTRLLVATASGNFERELTIDIIDSSYLRIPERAIPAEGKVDRIEVDDRIYYRRIDMPLPSGQRIEFTLIPRERLADPPTFYLMTHEVNNGWYAEFANEQDAEFQANSAWQLGALAGTELLGVEGKFSEYPVVQVTADEAHQFAHWLGGLLPSTNQWDKAAGANERGDRAGPYLGDGQRVCVASLEAGPCPGGSSPDDQSPFLIWDMAGNVSELTRNLLGSSLTVPLAQRLSSDRVILRGNNYHSAAPWDYEEGDGDAPASLQYDEHSPAVGFRVAIEML